MKSLAYILLAAGLLVGAYATALDIRAVRWELFTAAAIVAALGVVLLKRQAVSLARSAELLELNRAELRESIDNVVNDLQALPDGSTATGEPLRDWIDTRLRPDLRRFADARESMVHLFGLQEYADIMSNFAAGERYINRVWSASADGYDDEAARYIEKARGQFEEARVQLFSAVASSR